MPSLLGFRIRNYKGIQHAAIDVSYRHNSPVITLIGLNESGKTTILEAISHFINSDIGVRALYESDSTKEISDLMPIHKRAAFTGSIIIEAIVQLKDHEIAEIVGMLKTFNHYIDEEQLRKPFSVKRDYRFEDSVYKETWGLWGFNFLVKTTKKGKFKDYERPADPASDLWLKTIAIIRKDLPIIAYFPTFLVDLPDRIYLKLHANETAVNKYYRRLVQSILESIDDDLNLRKHVIDRIAEFQKAQENEAWLPHFWTSTTKKVVDSVFQKIAYAVTKEVIGSWSKVFNRPSGAKSVSIDWGVDPDKNYTPYMSFNVSDGDSRYSVSERSLGFRWFFSFLLFTAFKGSSSRPTFFLFDEPAANLHAKAQAELLKNFVRIAKDGNKIIYSTHSHHMINPNWLSAAYIVENTAINYDANDDFELNIRPTDIRVETYRNFASQYPERVSYFQPILEKLEYVTPEVAGRSPFVLLEGISDYHLFKSINDMLGVNKYGLSLIPGSGAGASSPLISYLLGRGERFVVLLDDDPPGREAAKRYKSNYHLSDTIVMTLARFGDKFKDCRLESLLDDETKANAKGKLSLKSNPNKKQIASLLAESCATADYDWISSAATKQITTILSEIMSDLQ